MRNLFFLILFLSRTGFAQESIVRLWQKGNKAAKVSNDEALILYQKAFDQAKKENNLLWQANICVDLSGALFGKGDYQKATDQCLNGLKILKQNKISNDSTEFKLHSAAAPCFRSLYDLKASFAHYEIANQIFHEHPELEYQILLYVTFHYSNQGSLWHSLGDLDRATQYYEKALSLAEKLEIKSDYALILHNLCGILINKKNHIKAIELYQKAFNVYNIKGKTIKDIHLANMYFSVGESYYELKEYSNSLTYLNKSKEIALVNLPQRKAIQLIEQIELLKANISLENKNTIKSEFLFKKILAKNMSSGFYYLNLNHQALIGLSHIEVLKGDYFNALKYVQRALIEITKDSTIGDLNNPTNISSMYTSIGILNILVTKVEILTLLYSKEKEIKYLELAFNTQKLSIAIGKKIRQSHETLDSRALFSHSFYNKYEKLIELSFLLYEKTKLKNYLDYGFKIMEESKSIILSDNLALQNSYRNSGSDSLITKLKANQIYLAYLKGSKDKDKEAIKTYELKVNQILEKLSIVNRSYVESFKSENYSNLNSFQKKLNSKSLYLNYSIIGNYIYATLTKKNKIALKKIPIHPEEFKFNKNLLKTALTTNPGPYSGFKARKSAAYFYNILIKPFEADLKGIDNLIINPDNEMIELSFDILVPHEKSNDYLIKKYNISYLNSALNYNDKIKNKFSRADQNWLSFAPFGSKTKNSSDINIQNLTILPSTIKEINGIKGQSIINEKSTKQTFVKTISELKDRVILIATHASENNGEPYLNFFPANDNYKLYANEIQYLDFKTPLVILGACESNAGKKMKGSGVLSIAKAFSIGGCPSVVGSLWEVHDESMAVLVSLFYKHLMRGERKDVALRLAKLEYLETETGLRNDPPYYWAHLQIIGDVSPLIIWPVILRYVMYGLMVVILSGSIVYGIRSRKRFFN
ncbi:CHAT domain-containing protein [Emticicia sp. CRIBPO]|uniref:CHAT domain-containing protein n=1 Tax=Emticicia sp. CRIBPO TaxID=2683258 RepID=UPI001411BE98|nr:CHAT domain-containing tetratricopeptide repeat protein [Emticicia sp. CRIBPO]NBA84699.1 CHAT domain-containing protein [Emticicia sp. CRIBPO]